MARNRVIYQSEALYVGPTGSAGATADQLIRVQDVSHTVDVARQDVNEFGKLAALAREVVEPPSVGTDFTYYLTNGINESALGFSLRGMGHTADINCVSGLIGENRDLILKNYYVKTVPEGADASYNTTTDKCSVIGVGNGFITDYTLNASVGDIPSVSVSLEAANMNFVTGNMTAGAFTIPADENPAINESDGQGISQAVELPQSNTGDNTFAALRPGDITLSFGGTELQMGGAKLSDLHVQNFSFNLPIGRSSLNEIGNKYPYFRAVDFPVVATMNASAILADIVEGNLSGVLCSEQTRDITASFKLNCSSTEAFKITMKSASMDSQNLSSSIGDNKTVDLTFSAQIGGPQDATAGIFMSGNSSA